MRTPLFLGLISYTLAVFVHSEDSTGACTVEAAGGGKDDAPALMTAVQRCAAVTIPVRTTLNISSKMNMTGLSYKHLVCDKFPAFPESSPW
jgi:galacturan 1,4-alpha-galacturonidase